MKTNRLICKIIGFLCLSTAPVLYSQIVADGATNILSSVTNLFPGNVTIGTNGPFTLLVLSDNTLLTNSANVIIGRNLTAKSNEVRLVSSSARWLMGGLFAFPTVYVGSNGAFNRLVVSNGATMVSYSAYIGAQASGSNNQAVVTGSGSLWRVPTLFVGGSGAGNQMIVSNGGLLGCDGSDVGLSLGSSNNLAIVTDPGSTWTNQNGFILGLFGAGNQLWVSNGATMQNYSGNIGNQPSGSNNLMVIMGAGSVCSNQTDLFVGSGSMGNRLVLSNGALLAVGANSRIGNNPGASSNSVTVSGPGTTWLTAAGVMVGSNAPFNSLTISDGARVVSAQVNNSSSVVGHWNGGSNNTVLVTGPGSVWTNETDFTVGNFGVGNRLVLNNGATMSVGGNSMLGLNAGANSNSVSVSDAGTSWRLTSNLYIGSNGTFNVVIVSNAALVESLSGFIGFGASGNSNAVVVTGSGSVWSNRDLLIIGESGGVNRLLVSNGGLVRSTGCDLGDLASSSNNEAVVTGAASLWTNSNGILNIGVSGSGNRLVISNGATVFNGLSTSGFIGLGPQSGNNEVQVTGAESSWANLGQVSVGYFGSRNKLVVTGGGTVFALNGFVVGEQSSSLSNRVVVDGGTLSATNSAGTAALNVRRGTNVLNAGLIEVDRLVLTNALGRLEFNGGTLITRGASASNNAFFIVGASGSVPAVWDVRAGVSNHTVGELFLGDNAASNQLLVTNGAKLASIECYLGHVASSSNNLALITGSGSVWNNDFAIYVGVASPGSQLVVSNGSTVASDTGVLGLTASSSNNVAVVSGAGSLWKNIEEVDVGLQGRGNRLIVTNGAVLSASNGVYIGIVSNSTGNRLVVDGAMMLVTNAGGTGLLEIRRGTNVLNSGLIEADFLLITNGSQGNLVFNGGTLSVKNSRVSIGNLISIGDGISPANFHLAGNGIHNFKGSAGLVLSNNATLTGSGSVTGRVQVSVGATLSPGGQFGKFMFSPPPILAGTVAMQIGKNGVTLTNDQIAASDTIDYGGVLTVSNLGPTALASGDTFQLFNASGYSGAFTSLNLSPLAPGLTWLNRLLVDGTIVVDGTPLPSFASITLSGASVIITGTNGLPNAPYNVRTATNLALPLSSWTSLMTNQFNANGGFAFTNSIVPGELQRYFRIRNSTTPF